MTYTGICLGYRREEEIQGCPWDVNGEEGESPRVQFISFPLFPFLELILIFFFFFFFFFQSHLFRWFVHKNQTSSSSSSRRRRRKKERKKEREKKEKKRMKLSRPAADPGHGSIPEVGPHLKGRDLGQRGSLAPGVQLNCRRRKKGYEFN